MIDNKGLVLGVALIVLLVALNAAPTGPATVDDPAPEGSGEATEPQQANTGGDDPADSNGSTDDGEPADDGEPTDSNEQAGGGEQIDSDGDGLLDSTERANSGLHADADPMRYDVFVEIDYHGVEDPETIIDALEPVVERFEQAPVDNPDGSTGIDLHLVLDERVSVDGLYDASGQVTIDTSARDYYDAGYHYALVDMSRMAPGRGNYGKFVVIDERLGGRSDSLRRTFMHELGHSLGVKSDKYRGVDSRAVSPDKYASVMNYNYYGSPQYNDGDPFDDWAIIADGYTPGRGGGGCPTSESYCPTASTPAGAASAARATRPRARSEPFSRRRASRRPGT